MKVYIGCGGDFRHGWVNVDIHYPTNVPSGIDYREWDLRQGLPPDIKDVETVFQSHLTEHLTWDDNINLLKACKSRLVPGGNLFSEIPDFLSTLKAYLNGDWEYFNDPAILSFCRGGTLASLLDYALHQKGTLGQPEHISYIDLEAMFYILREAGFSNIKQVNYRPGLSNPSPLRQKYSIYVEAIND